MLYCLGKYNNKECPIKKTCARFMEMPENTQNIFKELPLKYLKNGEFRCDFWKKTKKI